MPNLLVKVPTATSPPLAGTESVYLVTAAGADARATVDSLTAGRAVSMLTNTLTGGQVAFPAVQVPSADANTLDDYEEGTWSPSLLFGGNAVGMTYGDQAGFYTKIGRVVNYQVYIRLTAKGSSTGAATISLPFAPNATATNYTTCSLRLNTVSFADFPQGRLDPNDPRIHLSEITNAGTVTDLDDTNFTDTGNVMINGSFIV